MVIDLSKNNSVFNHFIAEIRDKKIQKDRMRFRRNMERIGEIMAYELSKKLNYQPTEIITPLGNAVVPVCSDKLVIACVLRASLPLHNGFLNYFDKAENTFISAYRKHNKDGSFDIEVEYISSPSLEGKVLIMADPMLATGASMALSYKAILEYGTPKHVHFASVIASTQGVEYLKKQMPKNATIWLGVVDDELTAQAYIVPGLGDAGDLAYGPKDN